MPTNDPVYYKKYYAINKPRIKKVRSGYYKRNQARLKAYQAEYRKRKKAERGFEVPASTSLADLRESVRSDVEVSGNASE